MSLEPAATAGALAKIERVLPHSLRERLQAVRDVVTFAATAHVPRPDSVVLMRLSLAIQRAERVQLWYQSGTAETKRRVDPYGLVFHWGRLYLAAWCQLRQAIRVFRLDRVAALEPVPETFARPLESDSLTCVTGSFAMTPWGWEVEVVFKTTLETVERQLPAGCAILEQHPEGTVLRGQYDRAVL
jgi:predicted DNA-binding transcriptional regulator YafY